MVAWYGLAPASASHPELERRVAEARVVDGTEGVLGEAVKNPMGEKIVAANSDDGPGARP